MIHLIDKHNCCGCTACASICPKHCITMQADNEGFLYPKVNEADCIDCGLCEKVCHELHPFEERKPKKVYATINKDEEIRLKSSSGGIFYLLAEKIITEGGVVFGARFDNQWQVVIDYAETMEGVKAFMGSKYVQARMETAYADAKHFLTEGRNVLFSGTPCQIAGLKHFLRKDYDNLLTVDIICHGTPSPMVWSRYLDEVVTAGRKAINDVQFRNKRNGWKAFNFTMEYNKDEQTLSLCSHHQQNHFMRAFLRDMILRPSCYQCYAKSGRSHSDITIADFWGINAEIPEMDDDKGTGLVLINTDKGQASLDWNKISFKETTAEAALRHNPAYYRSVAAHPKREEFFNRLDESESVNALITECLRPSFMQYINIQILHCKQLIKKVLIYVGGGKTEVTNQPEMTSIPSMTENASVSSITFRNKYQGWKSYRMEIIIK
ncbi:MAG: Coenzyme F420 hydrogenase/dehydrogenase, beta subunit C-terminal domain [Candidatus Aphodosoma sp.]